SLTYSGRSAVRPDRHEVVLDNGSNVEGSEGDESLRPAQGGNKLDFQSVGFVHLNHSPEVSLLQAVRGQVTLENYDIEPAKLHAVPPGYAVTNRGASSPPRTIHT